MVERRSAREDLVHLRTWRAYRSMTLKELAEASGVSLMGVQRLESGHARANPVTVTKLARALGITRKQLIEQEPDETILPKNKQEEHQQLEGEKKEVGALA